jgi:hypothetical protein
VGLLTTDYLYRSDSFHQTHVHMKHQMRARPTMFAWLPKAYRNPKIAVGIPDSTARTKNS